MCHNFGELVLGGGRRSAPHRVELALASIFGCYFVFLVPNPYPHHECRVSGGIYDDRPKFIFGGHMVGCFDRSLHRIRERHVVGDRETLRPVGSKSQLSKTKRKAGGLISTAINSRMRVRINQQPRLR